MQIISVLGADIERYIPTRQNEYPNEFTACVYRCLRTHEMFISVSFVQPNMRKNCKPFRIRVMSVSFKRNTISNEYKCERNLKKTKRCKKQKNEHRKQIANDKITNKLQTLSFQMLFYGFGSADPSEIHSMYQRAVHIV